MKPSILVLTSTYPRWQNDVEPAFVHELSKRLACNYDVFVVAPHFEGAALQENMDGVNVQRFRYFYPGKKPLVYEGGMLMNIQRHPWLVFSLPFYLFAQFRLALRLARRQGVVVIHAHWVIPQGFLATFLKPFCRDARLVVTSHGGDVYGLNGFLLRRIKRLVYGACDAITVVSSSMARDLSQQLNGCNIQIAPMGVDMQERFLVDKPLGGRRDIVFVGRLVEKKGVDVLLRAFALLLGDFPGLKLRIVGHGPYLDDLERLAGKLEIDGAVEFIGPVPNHSVPEWLNRHAVAVVPSVVAASGDQEGLGLVSIEAMACGCAVIASDLPAIRDVVDGNSNGLLFEPGNVEALEHCMRRLLSDELLRVRIAGAGRESVLERFDWSVAAENYRRLFTSLG